MGLSYKTVLLASAARAPFTGFLLKDGQESITVAKSNGASSPVYFGAIEGGTVLGKITASGKYRPCAKQIVNGAYGPGVVLPMQSVDNFEVGDVVTIADVSTSGTVATTRTVTTIDRVSSPPTLTISGANVTVEAGDYVYVEDGSGTARGILDSDGVSTLAGQDADGLARYEDADGILVFRGVVDETKVDAVNNLNTWIKADLVDQANGADITFR